MKQLEVPVSLQKMATKHLKSNMDTKNDGLENVFPFKHGYFGYRHVRFHGVTGSSPKVKFFQEVPQKSNNRRVVKFLRFVPDFQVHGQVDLFFE